MPFPHKFNQRIVDFLRMRGAQKVLTIINRDEPSRRGVDEELDLLLGVRNRVDCVIRTLDIGGINNDVSETLEMQHSHAATSPGIVRRIASPASHPFPAD